MVSLPVIYTPSGKIKRYLPAFWSEHALMSKGPGTHGLGGRSLHGHEQDRGPKMLSVVSIPILAIMGC